jgi:hypothetical protein
MKALTFKSITVLSGSEILNKLVNIFTNYWPLFFNLMEATLTGIPGMSAEQAYMLKYISKWKNCQGYYR